MRKIQSFLTVMLLIMCFGGRSNGGDGLEIIHARVNKLEKRIEKIREVFRKYPEDAGLHVAAGDMCRLVGGIPGRNDFTFLSEYEAAVKVDPGNRLARVLLMKRRAFSYAGGVKMYQRDMKRADDIEAGKVEPPPAAKQAGWYDEMKTESGRKGWAENVRKAAASRKPTPEQRAQVVRQLEESEGIDPDNALYNYLHACIYFAEGEKEKAMAEIEEGLGKKYVSEYTRERMRARKRLLDEVDFPFPDTEFFLTTYATFSMRFVCEDLIKIGKEHEENKKPEEAEKVYNMVVRIGEQSKQDNFFVGQEIQSLDAEEYGLKHLKELYERTNKSDKEEEVVHQLEKTKSRMDYLFALEERVPSSTRVAKRKSYVEELVEKGELAVLESLPPK